MARRVLQGGRHGAGRAGRSIHQWLSLPAPWTANALARARDQGLSVASSDAFRAGVDAPNAIRVSLGAEADRAQLEQALGNAGRADAQPAAAAARRGGLSCAATAVLTAPRRSFEPWRRPDGDDSRRAGHDSRRSQFTCR